MSSQANCSETMKEIGKLKYCPCQKCLLGRGSYGPVFRGKFLTESASDYDHNSSSITTEAAVKRVDKSATLVEIEILSKVNRQHENVINFYAVEESDPEFWY